MWVRRAKLLWVTARIGKFVAFSHLDIFQLIISNAEEFHLAVLYIQTVVSVTSCMSMG
jgi:hypothetical protein